MTMNSNGSSLSQQQMSEPKAGKNENLEYTCFSPANRRLVIGIVSIAGFLGPLAGGIYLPALPVLQEEFDVSSATINATVSVFMAACALSPLFWSAFADWNGRRPLYIFSLALYLVVTILMATLPADFGALVFLRMVQAFGCSSVISLGVGTVADVTEPAGRGSAMSIFLLGPNLGPTLGPVIGGIITGLTSWRWTFGFLAILVGLILLLIIVALPETLRSRVGNARIYANKSFLLWPPRLTSPKAPESECGPSPMKPSVTTFWHLLCYQPVSISSFYTAMLFATYFSIAVNLPVSLTSQYHWSVTAVGGGYLALGIAIVSGSLLAGRLSDLRRSRIARHSSAGHAGPESRLSDQIWGNILCVTGSLMYGWFVEKNIHPAGVIAATFLAGFGMSSVLVTTFAFITECAPTATASAMALENLMRNPAAAISAAVTPILIAKMGAGWFYTGFAFLDLFAVGIGGWLLQSRGPHWRQTSTFTKVPDLPPTAGDDSSSSTFEKNISD